MKKLLCLGLILLTVGNGAFAQTLLKPNSELQTYIENSADGDVEASLTLATIYMDLQSQNKDLKNAEGLYRSILINDNATSSQKQIARRVLSEV
ncbi:MAG: hypothetical protein AAB680_06640, partial [Pseudomonadota bacterium]